jgi:Arc/MetJ family transcription regulator
MLELHLDLESRCIRSWRVPVGRTNIVLDDDLIRRAMQVSGAKTKREAVDRALRELVARASVYQALRRLKGKMPWEGDVNAWRRRR